MLNAVDAEAFLVARFGHDVSVVSPIGQGEWSRAYAFQRAGAEYIVRFSALDEDFRKDRSPRATARAICQSRSWSRSVRPVVASSRSRNAPLAGSSTISTKSRCVACCRPSSPRSMRPEGSISRRHPAMASGARTDMLLTRAGARRCSPSRTTVRGADARLAERLVASPTGSGPFDEALARLDALIPDSAPQRHLIHSDLLNYNVLVADSRISAVLDWGCAMYGDFLYDLAWFEFWAPWYAAWRGIDFRREAARHYASIGLVVPRFDQRLTGCQIHIGMAAQAYNAFKERWDALEETRGARSKWRTRIANTWRPTRCERRLRSRARLANGCDPPTIRRQSWRDGASRQWPQWPPARAARRTDQGADQGKCHRGTEARSEPPTSPNPAAPARVTAPIQVA